MRKELEHHMNLMMDDQHISFWRNEILNRTDAALNTGSWAEVQELLLTAYQVLEESIKA